MQEGKGGSTSATAAKLKYSICRNLASIFKDQGDLMVAIDTYLKATHIDDTDITTWLQLSKVAQLQGNLPIARMALEKVKYLMQRCIYVKCCLLLYFGYVGNRM